MRKNDISKNLQEVSFDFFYWFSRFEFSLKENQFFVEKFGGAAAPDWRKFITEYSKTFVHTENTKKLLDLAPKRQVVVGNKLIWRSYQLEDKPELEKVVTLLKAVRNNLFHGGKHGAEGWDNPERTEELLKVGKLVLDDLARLSIVSEDYDGFY